MERYISTKFEHGTFVNVFWLPFRVCRDVHIEILRKEREYTLSLALTMTLTTFIPSFYIYAYKIVYELANSPSRVEGSWLFSRTPEQLLSGVIVWLPSFFHFSATFVWLSDLLSFLGHFFVTSRFFHFLAAFLLWIIAQNSR